MLRDKYSEIKITRIDTTNSIRTRLESNRCSIRILDMGIESRKLWSFKCNLVAIILLGVKQTQTENQLSSKIMKLSSSRWMKKKSSKWWRSKCINLINQLKERLPIKVRWWTRSSKMTKRKDNLYIGTCSTPNCNTIKSSRAMVIWLTWKKDLIVKI